MQLLHNHLSRPQTEGGLLLHLRHPPSQVRTPRGPHRLRRLPKGAKGQDGVLETVAEQLLRRQAHMLPWTLTCYPKHGHGALLEHWRPSCLFAGGTVRARCACWQPGAEGADKPQPTQRRLKHAARLAAWGAELAACCCSYRVSWPVLLRVLRHGVPQGTGWPNIESCLPPSFLLQGVGHKGASRRQPASHRLQLTGTWPSSRRAVGSCSLLC